MRSKFIFYSTAVLAGMILCGCETTSSSRDAQYKRQQMEILRQNQEQVTGLNGSLTTLQNTNNEIVKSINDMNQRMAVLEQKNQSLEKNFAAIQQQYSADKQERQTSMNKMMDQVAKETANAINKASASSGSSSGPSGSGEFYEYKVESGATLNAVAKAYKVSVRDILAANKMKDNAVLRVGQVIYIPKKK